MVDELKQTLQAKLFKKASDQIPSGFILFKDAAFMTVDDNNVDIASHQSDTMPIRIKGTLYGILFNEEGLTKKIAEDAVSGYDGSPVYISGIRDLHFSLLNKDNLLFGSVRNISFNLSGVAKIVYRVDQDKLTHDLLGKSKKDFNQILLQYPNIDSADLTISPFWKISLPDKTKDIKVNVNYPK